MTEKGRERDNLETNRTVMSARFHDVFVVLHRAASISRTDVTQHEVHSVFSIYRLRKETDYACVQGHVAELADALDLGSNGVIRAGSTPVVPTIHLRARRRVTAE